MLGGAKSLRFCVACEPVWWADQQESCHGDVVGSEYQYRCSVSESMWSELKIRSFYTQPHMWVLSNVVQHPVSSILNNGMCLDTSGMSDRTEHRCHRHDKWHCYCVSFTFCFRIVFWFRPNRNMFLIGERQEAQILKFNAPPLHT